MRHTVHFRNCTTSIHHVNFYHVFVQIQKVRHVNIHHVFVQIERMSSQVDGDYLKQSTIIRTGRNISRTLICKTALENNRKYSISFFWLREKTFINYFFFTKWGKYIILQQIRLLNKVVYNKARKINKR